MTTTTELALQQHPLSAAFPAMPEQELAALALDIEEHGQREPGVLYEGMVLDGWHRYLACDKAGVEFEAVEFDGDDPVAFVLSKNLHRRHLSASQRAAAVVAASNWKPRGRPAEKMGNFSAADEKSISAKDMARVAEVSERTIKEAKAAHAAGLGEEVKAGKVSAHVAAEVAKLPKAKREKAVEAIKAGEEPALPKAKVIVAERKFERLYEEVKKTLEETLEKNAELADVARELNDKLTMFETVEPDEQQKLISTLQKRIVRLEAEVERVTVDRNNWREKSNQLIRQVKIERRKAR